MAREGQRLKLREDIVRLGRQLRAYLEVHPTELEPDAERLLDLFATYYPTPPSTRATSQDYPEDWENDDKTIDQAFGIFASGAESLLSIRTSGLRRSSTRLAASLSPPGQNPERSRSQRETSIASTESIPRPDLRRTRTDIPGMSSNTISMT